MSKPEKTLWFVLAGLRATLAFLDLAGVFIIGYLATSSVAFLTSGSDSGRGFEFAGFRIPALSMGTLPWVAGAVLLLFLS